MAATSQRLGSSGASASALPTPMTQADATPARPAAGTPRPLTANTQHRLAVLQGRVEGGNAPMSRRREAESVMMTLDDKLTRLVAAHEDERRAAAEQERVRFSGMEERLERLQTQLTNFVADMEAEEETRRTSSNSFAKNFALRIEERLLKLEALVAKHRHHLSESEDQRVKNIKVLEHRMSEIERRLDGVLPGNAGVVANDEARSDALADLTRRVQEQQAALTSLQQSQASVLAASSASGEGHGATGADESKPLVSLRREVDELRTTMETELSGRRREDGDLLRRIEESMSYVKESKESWLRMLDYKLMPIKAAQEEDAASMARREREQLEAVTSLGSKVDDVVSALAKEQKARAEEILTLQERVEAEAQERESTEDAMTTLLEQTIARLDEMMLLDD